MKYNNVQERKKWEKFTFIGKEREKLVCNDACRILGIDFT